MTVSVCVIAYNEQAVLHGILEDIVKQEYNHENIEVVLVDNNSTDDTLRVMKEFKENQKSFSDIKVVHNYKTSQASGWNLAIKTSTKDIIIRIDAHASIPADFVGKNVKVIEGGEDISGGPRPNILDSSTPFKETLLLAESSMFGSSIAGYRRKHEKMYVNSMFHGAYRREVFDKAGLFNENLGRTEDNEMHYRIREKGYKLCFSPDIVSYQHTRSSLGSMLKQKYANGYWIGLTMGVCPKCLSIYHFVPFAFVCAIILTTLMTVATGSIDNVIIEATIKILTAGMWAAYWLLAIAMGIIAVATAEKSKRNISNILLPILFFMLHISYGIGTIIGMIKMPSFVKGIK